MITAIVRYEGELRTSMTHLFSHKEVITDAPLDNQGLAQSFSPTDLVASALGSCMLTIMGIKARDLNLDLTGTEVEITKVMASEPRRISEIHAVVKFLPNSFSLKEKTILENAAKTCPVAKSLSAEIKQAITFLW
jgi:uncharacterized OsmC-like protein